MWAKCRNVLGRWWAVGFYLAVIVFYMIEWYRSPVKQLAAEATSKAIELTITATSILLPLSIGLMTFLLDKEKLKEFPELRSRLPSILSAFWGGAGWMFVSMIIGVLNLNRLPTLTKTNDILVQEVNKTAILGGMQFWALLIGVGRIVQAAWGIKKHASTNLTCGK
jgi:hypothetical protein